jgi:hypothetical protein
MPPAPYWKQVASREHRQFDIRNIIETAPVWVKRRTGAVGPGRPRRH